MKHNAPNMKRIVLANMNAKVYCWPLNVSQGSVATDLRRSGSFNPTFLRRSYLKLTVKKNYENRCCRSYHKIISCPLFETRGT